MPEYLFSNKVAHFSPATLLKKRLWHSCFSANFAKFVRTPFSYNTSGDCFWRVFFFSVSRLSQINKIVWPAHRLSENISSLLFLSFKWQTQGVLISHIKGGINCSIQSPVTEQDPYMNEARANILMNDKRQHGREKVRWILSYGISLKVANSTYMHWIRK